MHTYIEKACEKLSTCGANVIAVDRKEELDKLTKDYMDKFECDLELEEDIEKIFKTITQKYVILDGIVNNAAFVGTRDLSGWNTTFDKQTIETWDRCMNVNLRAIFKIVQSSHEALLKSVGTASIVNIGSIYGILGPQWDLYEGTNMGNSAAYAASKGGLVQLRWMATTLAPDIRTNIVSAGGIDKNEDFVNRYQSKTPLKRMASEKDVVDIIFYYRTWQVM